MEFLVITSNLDSMKKLIENNIAKDYIAKTIRCIDNVHS